MLLLQTQTTRAHFLVHTRTHACTLAQGDAGGVRYLVVEQEVVPTRVKLFSTRRTLFDALGNGNVDAVFVGKTEYGPRLTGTDPCELTGNRFRYEGADIR